jgi:predicted DNA-binding protein
MKQEELNNRLDKLFTNLKKSNELKDQKTIEKNIEELNKLWREASEEMLSNARKEGFNPPKKD